MMDVYETVKAGHYVARPRKAAGTITINGRDFTLRQFQEMLEPCRGPDSNRHIRRMAKALGVTCTIAK